MNLKSVACCLALGSAMAIIAPRLAAKNPAPQDPAAQRVTRQTAPPQSQDGEEEGQRVFEQNCARCHNAPEGFSPRITGTIVRHMRVRASLSRHDEEVLLHYFNP
jgi:cytochrome c5